MREMVSVIITTYKGAKKLQRAILSVLGQTYSNVEIIVVDDNNPGTIERADTEKVMATFKKNKNIRYIQHKKNKNGAVARNTGIRAATGKYIAFLDDDDFFLPDRVKICVEAIDNSDYVACYTESILITNGEVKRINNVKNDPSCKDVLLNQNLLGTGSNLFVKKTCIEGLNGFDERFLRYQDVEFILRVLMYGKMKAVDAITVVKDVEDIRFMPKFSRLRDMQLLFQETFETQISELSNDEKCEYYSVKYYDLILSAFESKKLENVKCAFSMLHSQCGMRIGFDCKIVVKGMISIAFPELYKKKIVQKTTSEVNLPKDVEILIEAIYKEGKY